MERGKRIEGVDGEIHLHEAIIQHIQSFLTCKEAAQTSILCKTWYNAWATGPIVDLDQRHFQSRGGADEFLEYSKRIMRRYEESNLKIESFRLCMEDIESDCFSLVDELIVDAMKLGACDLNVELEATEFYLPLEVLRSESLLRLSVSGCGGIDLEATGGKVGFSKLKSLSLRGMCIFGFFTFDIISNCPLLEELVLSDCTCFCTVLSSSSKTVEIQRMLPLESLTESEKRRLGSIVDAPIRPYDNLKCLYLQSFQIDALLFNDTSRSFPCLKDLTLEYCNPLVELKISSPSLEFLSIAHMTVKRVKFDLPNLRKFTYKGAKLPGLSFEAASREWESDITIVYMQNFIIYSWLPMLIMFLEKLRLSKISLSLCFEMLTVKGLGLLEHVPREHKPELENLMLSIRAPTSVCSILLKRVFWTCRPKFVTHSWPQTYRAWEENRDMLKLLCKTLIKKGSLGRCIPRRHMFDKYGLEKVDVEVFEDSVAEWRPLLWKALVDALNSVEKRPRLRFKLRWRQTPSTQ